MKHQKKNLIQMLVVMIGMFLFSYIATNSENVTVKVTLYVIAALLYLIVLLLLKKIAKDRPPPE